MKVFISTRIDCAFNDFGRNQELFCLKYSIIAGFRQTQNFLFLVTLYAILYSYPYCGCRINGEAILTKFWMVKKRSLENPNIKKLITVFLKNKQRYFSVKELSFRCGMALGKTRSVLQYLSKRRLLNQAEKKQQKYHQINTAAKSFSEFTKNLKISKVDLSKDLLARKILSVGEIKIAILSGIFVGLPKAEVDLLLIGKISEKKLEECLKFLEKLSGNEINYAIFSENEYFERLYNLDWFLREIIDNPHVTLIDRISGAIERNEIRRGVARMMS